MRKFLLIPVFMLLASCASEESFQSPVKNNSSDEEVESAGISQEQLKAEALYKTPYFSFIEEVDLKAEAMFAKRGVEADRVWCYALAMDYTSLNLKDGSFYFDFGIDDILLEYASHELLFSFEDLEVGKVSHEGSWKVAWAKTLQKAVGAEGIREKLEYWEEFWIEDRYINDSRGLAMLEWRGEGYDLNLQLFLNLEVSLEGHSFNMQVNKIIAPGDILPAGLLIENKSGLPGILQKYLYKGLTAHDDKMKINGVEYSVPSLNSWDQIKDFLIYRELEVMNLDTKKVVKLSLDSTPAFKEGINAFFEHDDKQPFGFQSTEYCERSQQ